MSTRRRHRVAIRLGIAMVLVAAQAAGIDLSRVAAASPTPSPHVQSKPVKPPGRLFGRAGTTGSTVSGATSPPTAASEFIDSVAIDGLTRPVAVRFAADGSVFVAEKSGIIKRFASLG